MVDDRVGGMANANGHAPPLQHPIFFPHDLKYGAPVNIMQVLSDNTKDARALFFLTTLTKRRDAALALLKKGKGDASKGGVLKIRSWLDDVQSAIKAYVELAKGVVESGRLRNTAVMYGWPSCVGGGPFSVSDAQVDVCQMVEAMALAGMEAARVFATELGDEGLGDESTKEILKALREAAGQWKHVEETELAKVDSAAAREAPDLQVWVPQAMRLECLAGAVELVGARYVRKGSKPKLVVGVLRDASDKYEAAAQLIPGGVAQRWRLFLEWKRNVILALAYVYQGLHLLESEEEECGQSVKCAAHAQELLDLATHLEVEMDKTGLEGHKSYSESHFFVRVRECVAVQADRFKRENASVYHKEVAQRVPDLEATESTVEDEVFRCPEPRWEAGLEEQGFLEGIEEPIRVVKGEYVDLGEGERDLQDMLHTMCAPVTLVLFLLTLLLGCILWPFKHFCGSKSRGKVGFDAEFV